MKITIVESWYNNLDDSWTASGGCFLIISCKNCPFQGFARATSGYCLDFRLNLIQQLNITSYPYTLDAADLYPELFI